MDAERSKSGAGRVGTEGAGRWTVNRAVKLEARGQHGSIRLSACCEGEPEQKEESRYPLLSGVEQNERSPKSHHQFAHPTPSLCGHNIGFQLSDQGVTDS